MKKNLIPFITAALILSAGVLTACEVNKSSSETESTIKNIAETEAETETSSAAAEETASTITTETQKENEAEIAAETTEDTQTETYPEGWVYDEETDGWVMYNVPESVWDELQAKTGLSDEEFAEEREKFSGLKNSKAYSWDDSEAPLTEEQIKEIHAEQASILAEMNGGN